MSFWSPRLPPNGSVLFPPAVAERSNRWLAGWTALAAALGAAAGISLYQRLEKRRLRQEEESFLDLSSAELPPSCVDVRALSRLEFGEAARELFFLDRRSSGGAPVLFLNHGSYGAVPRPVMRYYELALRRAEAHPDLWFRSQGWPMIQKALAEFAQFLHADPAGLVFVPNATTGINAVLNSFPFSREPDANEVILTTDSAYNSIKLALRRRADQVGAQYVEFALALPIQSEQSVIDSYAAELDRLERLGKKVKFLVVDAIASPMAVVLPYEGIARLARKRGVFCVIDGAHAVGQLDVNLSPADGFRFDAWVTNGHKWAFSVKGCALLWVSPAAREWVHPLVTSHSTREGFARAFWMQGTRDDMAYVSAVEGLRFLKAVGIHRARSYCTALLDHASLVFAEKLGGDSKPAASASASAASSAPPSSVLHLCPRSMFPPNIRSLRLPWQLPAEFSDAVRFAFVYRLQLELQSQCALVLPVAYDPHTRSVWIRFSAQIYNTKQEYTDAVAVLAKFQPEQLRHMLNTVARELKQ